MAFQSIRLTRGISGRANLYPVTMRGYPDGRVSIYVSIDVARHLKLTHKSKMEVEYDPESMRARLSKSHTGVACRAIQFFKIPKKERVKLKAPTDPVAVKSDIRVSTETLKAIFGDFAATNLKSVMMVSGNIDFAENSATFCLSRN